MAKKKTSKKAAPVKNSYWYKKQKEKRLAREAKNGGARVVSPAKAKPSPRGRYVRKSEQGLLQHHMFAVQTLTSYISTTEAQLQERAAQLVAEAVKATTEKGSQLTITVNAAKDDRYKMLARCVMLAKEILAMEQGEVAAAKPTVARKVKEAVAAAPEAKAGTPSREELVAQLAALDATAPAAEPAPKKAPKAPKAGKVKASA